MAWQKVLKNLHQEQFLKSMRQNIITIGTDYRDWEKLSSLPLRCF